ncbi:uncharacterized protein Dmoj_GI26626 [Drosophila mojavensis]|uniref:Uncharacterized protein n=1 Tax=Drosophila mojavensis TaxID=7230 RepID=A0A0Q9X9Z8_DROMO|nr:uncharacterized protein Dmoj_GI26626 [Drosophila mojavensis]
MRLQFIYIHIIVILLALLCGHLSIGQVDDDDVGADGTKRPEKQEFPVWNDANGEWIDRDN